MKTNDAVEQENDHGSPGFASVVLGTPKYWVFWGTPLLILLMGCLGMCIAEKHVGRPEIVSGQVQGMLKAGPTGKVGVTCLLIQVPKGMAAGLEVRLRFPKTGQEFTARVYALDRSRHTVDLGLSEGTFSPLSEGNAVGQAVELRSRGALVSLGNLFMEKIKNKTKL